MVSWIEIKKLRSKIKIWSLWTKRDGIIEVIITLLSSRIENDKKNIHIKEITDFGFNRSTVHQNIKYLYNKGVIKPHDYNNFGLNYFTFSKEGINDLKNELYDRLSLLNAIGKFTNVEIKSQIIRLEILRELLNKIDRFLFGDPIE